MFNTHKRHSFTPDKLEDKVLFWITARDITVDGKVSVVKDGLDRVSQMNDLSSWNNHVIQSDGGLQPLWVDGVMGSNGLPYVDFALSEFLICENIDSNIIFRPVSNSEQMGSIFVVAEHIIDQPQIYWSLGSAVASNSRFTFLGTDNALTNTGSTIQQNRFGSRTRGVANLTTTRSNDTDLTNGQQYIGQFNKPAYNDSFWFIINDERRNFVSNPGFNNNPNSVWLANPFGNVPVDLSIGCSHRYSQGTPSIIQGLARVSEIILTTDINNKSKEDIVNYLRRTYGL